MKKIAVIALMLFAAGLAKAQDDWAEKLIEFKKLSKEHKLEWMDFAKKMKTEKINLKKKHKTEWFDYSVDKISTWQKTPIATAQDKNDLFHKQLKTAVIMSRQHGKEWKELCEKLYKEGNETYQKQQEQLDRFEESYEPTLKKIKQMEEAE